MMIQSITSSRTSRNSIPLVLTRYKFSKGTRILDWGCGKYNKAKEFSEKNGYIYNGYDPYNRTDIENKQALKEASKGVDVIIISNVLNVIKEKEAQEELIKSICKYASDNTKIIFKIYTGDKSGLGKETKCGWQRNEKTINYAKLINNFINIDKIKGDFIECSLYENKREVAI